MAISRCSVTSCTAWIQPSRHFSNAAGSRRARTRAEGVVGGDAVGQVEEAGEPGPAVEAEFVDGGEGVGPGEDAADGDEDDVDQGVLAGALDARVLEVLEVVVERGGSVAGHDRVHRGRMMSLVRPRCTPASSPQATSDRYLDAAALPSSRANNAGAAAASSTEAAVTSTASSKPRLSTTI